MKVGDLVKAADCKSLPNWGCPCIFCENNSSRIGVVTRKKAHAEFERKGQSGMEKQTYIENYPRVPYWTVTFDFGEWDLHRGEMEILHEPPFQTDICD